MRKETWLDIFLNVDYERSNVLFSQVEMKKHCFYTLTTALALSTSDFLCLSFVMHSRAV